MRLFKTKAALKFIGSHFRPMSLKTFYRLAPLALGRAMRRGEIYSEAQLKQIVEYQRTHITKSNVQRKRAATRKINRGAL